MNILSYTKGQAESFVADKLEKLKSFTKFYKLSYHFGIVFRIYGK